ncbi:MAG: hypothetical protein K9K67_11825 [Bacteriovoracaceae bacterium]|nr:hypothetical protein [Bacteriovoracaceae bacterium]
MLPKFLKLLRLLGLSILLSFKVNAWEQLLDYQGAQFQGFLEYDSSLQEVRLNYKRKGNLGRFKIEGPFKINSPTSVDHTVNHFKLFLERQVFGEEEKQIILTRIEEFKYLSSLECQALHFSLQSTSSQNAISALMQEVEKIRLAQNPGAEAFRSLLVREFGTEEGKIQLRMVLDREGDFLKFSFAKEQGDLSKLNWSQQEGIIILLNNKGKTILELDLRSFNKDGGLVIVRHPKSIGLENNERSYFRFSKDNKNWSIHPYTTQHFTETVIRDGVALTSGTADHTPVIQLNGSEIAFARVDLQKIKENKLFSDMETPRLRQIENYYNHCMGERLSFIFEEEKLGFNDETYSDVDQSQTCTRLAETEALYILLEKEVEIRDLPSSSLDDLRDSLKSCLVANGLATIEGDFFSFNYLAYLSATDEDFIEKRDNCFYAAKRELVLQQIKDGIFSGKEIKEQINNERTLILLWETVKRSVENNCLDIVQQESLDICLSHSNILINENLFLTQISTHLSNLYEGDNGLYSQKRTELVDSFQNCRKNSEPKITEAIRTGTLVDEVLREVRDEELKCAQRATLYLSSMNADRTFKNALTRMGLTLSDNSGSVELYESCIQERMQDENSVTNLISRISYYQETCITQALRPSVSIALQNQFKSLLDKYSFLMNDQNVEDVLQDSQRIIDRELELWTEVDTLSERMSALQLPYFGLVLESHLLTLKDGLNSDESKNTFERGLNVLFSDSSSRPLSLKIKKYLRDILKMSEHSHRSAKDYLNVALNDFLKEAHKLAYPLKTTDDITAEVLLVEDAEDMRVRVNEAVTNCIEEYSPNKSEPLSKKFVECEKMRLANVAIELTRRRLERSVSQHFPLSSSKANHILSPIQYLETCFEKMDSHHNSGISEYKTLIAGCVRVAELDVSYNISNAKVDNYGPLLSRRGFQNSVTSYCYNILFNNLSGEGSLIPRRGEVSGAYRDLRKMQQGQRERAPFEGSLLRYFLEENSIDPDFAESDLRNVEGLVKTFASNSQYSRDWWGEKLAACEKGTDDFINVSFRDYVIESIPSLAFGEGSDTNTQLMRDFFDFELIEGLLAYKKSFEDKVSLARLGAANPVPSERVINPELGVTAMTNFIQILGSFISKGFVYDEEAMKTELIIFQSELKAFLQWSASNPDNISIREAMDFFKESKLAEHLALAVISENTYKKFQLGLNKAKSEELDKLFQSASCPFISCLDDDQKLEHQRILNKYIELESITKEMTASYDFRRIISPESRSGANIISKIKENILMPEILGLGVTATADREVMDMIGEAILKDNTDGGFAERFVEVAAQFSLNKERGQRWGITKFFFFDSKDFDWDTLKQTEAGSRAIDYYARFILLPRFLGERQSEYIVQTRLEQFRRLLTSAQGQNSN